MISYYTIYQEIQTLKPTCYQEIIKWKLQKTQGCSITQERNINKKEYNSRRNNHLKKPSGRKSYTTGRNMKK